MDIDNAIKQVKEYLLQNNSHVELTENCDLEKKNLLGSLQMMGLVVVLEKLRGKPISLNDIDIDKLRTLNLIKSNFLLDI